MKGIVFNVLENFINENFGEKTWEDGVEKANLQDEIFVSTKIYDDKKLIDIFTSIVSLKKLVAEEALILFGEFLFDTLSTKYAEILVQFDNPKDFLKGLDGIIHVEVRKMMMGSNPPQFLLKKDEEKEISLEYRSERQLCTLAKGLINGLNKKFGNTFTYEHTKCIHNGDDLCLFEFKFE
jgi:hypothetical protein